MPDFSFLHEDAGNAVTSEWEWDPIEHRDAGIYDSNGRRIGFEIRRQRHLRQDDRTPHVRWVSVTKNGEWLRNDYTSSHETREQAEAWVEKRIRDSLARYSRLERKRNEINPEDLDFSMPVVRVRQRPKARTFSQSLDKTQRDLDGCAKQLYGCGCGMIVLGLAIMSPFILAFLL